jgi:hypothetical protein
MKFTNDLTRLRRRVQRKQHQFMAELAIQGDIEGAARDYREALAAYRAAVFSEVGLQRQEPASHSPAWGWLDVIKSSGRLFHRAVS